MRRKRPKFLDRMIRPILDAQYLTLGPLGPDRRNTSPHPIKDDNEDVHRGRESCSPTYHGVAEVRSTPEYPDARASGGDRREGHAREDVVDRNREVSRDTDGETPRKKPLGSQFSSRCAAPALKIPSVSFPPLASHIASCPPILYSTGTKHDMNVHIDECTDDGTVLKQNKKKV
jgi:hypothetical protein